MREYDEIKLLQDARELEVEYSNTLRESIKKHRAILNIVRADPAVPAHVRRLITEALEALK